MEPVMCADAPDQPVENIEQELIACQRRAMLGALTGIIAHEYNNLMTPVVARAQSPCPSMITARCRRRSPSPCSRPRRPCSLHAKCSSLPAETRADTGPCRLRDLIDGAITSSVRPLEKDGIELTLDVPDDLQVRAQPLMFEQLLLNLILNARTAMKRYARSVDDSCPAGW